MAIWAPGGSVPIGGVKSPWFGTGVQWSSGAFMDEDSNKIVYFSPSFNGISFGASYAPKDTNDSYASSADNEGKQSEQLAVALGYSVDVMGGSISAGVGYETHSTEATMVPVMIVDPSNQNAIRLWTWTNSGLNVEMMRHGLRGGQLPIPRGCATA